MRALLFLVVLGVAQWWVRPEPPRNDARPVSERFSGAVHTAFLGGFRPILVQYLWYDVDRAYVEGRELDVLGNLALLQRIDPTNTKAVLYMAPFLAHTLGGREQRPTARLKRIEDAIELLERTERRVPDDVMLPFVRAQLISSDWGTSDARLYQAWTERRGKTPSAEALEAAERAYALAPHRATVARVYAEKLRVRAIEIALADKDFAGAHALLVRALAADAGFDDDPAPPVGVLLVRSWEEALRGLSLGDPSITAGGVLALQRVIQLLEAPGDGMPATEDLLVLAILGNCMDLGRSTVATAVPEDVLSLVVAVHNIQAVLEGRLGSGARPEIRKDLRALSSRLLERAPELRDRIPLPLR